LEEAEITENKKMQKKENIQERALFLKVWCPPEITEP
jgi:hypothetical protein